MWPAKVHRPFLVALFLVLALGTHLFLRWSRPGATRSASDRLADSCMTLPELDGWVLALAFSADSTLLAVGVGDGMARGQCRLYDLRDGRCRTLQTAQRGAVAALAFSPTAASWRSAPGPGP